MARTWRWLLAVALPLVLAACTSPGNTSPGSWTGPGPAAVASLRAIRHVWVIELENRGYTQTFGDPPAGPYLARTLPRMGALLENYYAIGHSSAANYVAQVSGQAPDLGTQADCPLWTPFPGDVVAGPYHQVPGEGCVYPAAVPTLGNQLSGRRNPRRGPGGTAPSPRSQGTVSRAGSRLACPGPGPARTPGRRSWPRCCSACST